MWCNMSEFALRVQGIGKEYQIAKIKREETLVEQLVGSLTLPFHRAKRLLQGQQTGASDLDETFWALRDISFEVKHGEVIGIIGRNGAGKSTLLKLLSRITFPTEGRIEINGRCGALLEVGTGFHQELTGRENVYMNGTILGMTKRDVDRRFDEIVEFSGVERFIDTPIKHYSSGMQLRLAFAVAAHLEPEILIVDEVLAVGDAAFQKRCIGKMNDVANEGRTVLFVSHNLPVVRQLCQRGILLNDGQIVIDDVIERALNAYINMNIEAKTGQRVWQEGIADEGVEELRVYAVRVRDHQGEVTATLDYAKSYTIEMEYELLQPIFNFAIGFSLYSSTGELYFYTYDADSTGFERTREPGRYITRCELPGWLLAAGEYTISIHATIVRMRWLCQLEHILSFDLNETERFDPAQEVQRPGLLAPRFPWKTQIIDPEPTGEEV